MTSKLEEALAQQLDFAAKDANGRWPYPAPVRQLHPMWCCEHRKVAHKTEGDWSAWCELCKLLAEDTQPGDPCAEPRHRYKRERDWAVDFAWPASKVIVECEGIVWQGEPGRHQRPAGFAADLEKYTALELAGWRVVRCSQREITSGLVLAQIEQALREAVTA